MLKSKINLVLSLLLLSFSQISLASGFNAYLLSTRDVGKLVCLNAMINLNDEVVDARINAQLQDVRGKQLNLFINAINVGANQVAPSVIVMGDVAFRQGEKVWVSSDGWYICR